MPLSKPSFNTGSRLAVIVALIATYVAGAAYYIRRAPTAPPAPTDVAIFCEGIGEILPTSLRESPESLIANVNLTMVNGVAAVRYPEPRGVQVNPWNVARYGLLEAVAYCGDRDASRLPKIAAQRGWLLRNLENRRAPDGRPFLATTYDFPVPPWTNEPGWVSALSQSAALAFLERTTPKDSPERKTVGKVAKAFAVKSTDGGIYSDFGDNGIFWQEYATPDKTSDIIGGHAAVVFIIAQELNRLSDFPELQARLRTMVQQGRRSIVQMLPFLIPTPGKILYDVHGFNTLRDKDYTYWLILSALKWMEESGEVSAEQVQRFAEIKPFEGISPPRPTDR